MSDPKFDMKKWDVNQVPNNLILNETEVDGSDSEDEEEKWANEYDVNDKFVNDESMDSDSDVSFFLKQNSKCRNDFDDEQQAGPSSTKSKLETNIDNYETFDAKSIVADSDEDGQLERNNTVKRGRKKEIYDDLDDI